jgi:hypothetical protein
MMYCKTKKINLAVAIWNCIGKVSVQILAVAVTNVTEDFHALPISLQAYFCMVLRVSLKDSF